MFLFESDLVSAGIYYGVILIIINYPNDHNKTGGMKQGDACILGSTFALCSCLYRLVHLQQFMRLNKVQPFCHLAVQIDHSGI